MIIIPPRRWISLLAVLAILTLALPQTVPLRAAPIRVLIHGSDIPTSQAAVEAAGGSVVTTMPHSQVLLADVSPTAIEALRAAGLGVTPDTMVGVAATMDPVTDAPTTLLYPSQAIGADVLQQNGLSGAGVTVAVLDSGMPPLDSPDQWTRITTNTLAYGVGHGAVADPPMAGPPATPWFVVYKDLVAGAPITNSVDPYGHGTHVLATLADGRKARGSAFSKATVGIAPAASLVVIRALDADGRSPYSRMIEAIEWVITHKDTLNIRVLNLSIQADVYGPYWFDPLNQAVMAAWDAGITVVVAAGNTGPRPATITVPGNVPYVITVGALKPGIYTENGVDALGQYSSAGPTESKFIKPDAVIAGSRVIAPLPATSVLAPQAGLMREKAKLELPRFKSAVDLNYYALSGTSMAAAETSGLVALLLQDEPGLTNNQVKYRLTATAQVLTDSAGNAAYSVWQQGAGRLTPPALISGTTTASANAGMALAEDRNHDTGTHYLGMTEYLTDTNAFRYPDPVVALSGYNSWAGGYNSWAGGYNSWAGGYNSWAGGYNS
ncbi:MAG TPA: S8 family peptidase, partial [Herpetosiphonaceae bacterium]|nr:S8 family peptidase [Herpetosiphonaceae bacterium]